MDGMPWTSFIPACPARQARPTPMRRSRTQSLPHRAASTGSPWRKSASPLAAALVAAQQSLASTPICFSAPGPALILCSPSALLELPETPLLPAACCSLVPNPNNIMYDKRVVRGNTYAAQILPAVRR